MKSLFTFKDYFKIKLGKLSMNILFLVWGFQVLINLNKLLCTRFVSRMLPWRHGVVVITTAQYHSTKSELRLCAGLNSARGLTEIRNGEDLWQWTQLEIRLNIFICQPYNKNNLSSSAAIVKNWQFWFWDQICLKSVFLVQNRTNQYY